MFIPAPAAEDNDPEERLAAEVPEPGSFAMEPKSTHQPATSSTSATSSPAGEKRGAVVLTSDQTDLIAKNKKAAQERRAQLKEEAQQIEEQEIFEAMQFLP